MYVCTYISVTVNASSLITPGSWAALLEPFHFNLPTRVTKCNYLDTYKDNLNKTIIIIALRQKLSDPIPVRIKPYIFTTLRYVA